MFWSSKCRRTSVFMNFPFKFLSFGIFLQKDDDAQETSGKKISLKGFGVKDERKHTSRARVKRIFWLCLFVSFHLAKAEKLDLYADRCLVVHLLLLLLPPLYNAIATVKKRKPTTQNVKKIYTKRSTAAVKSHCKQFEHCNKISCWISCNGRFVSRFVSVVDFYSALSHLFCRFYFVFNACCALTQCLSTVHWMKEKKK